MKLEGERQRRPLETEGAASAAGSPIEQLVLQAGPYALKETEPSRFVAKNRDPRDYVFLDAQEKELLEMLDGTRSLADILQQWYDTKGVLPVKTLYNLVANLYVKGFIRDRHPALDELVGTGSQAGGWRLAALMRGKLIPLPGAAVLRLASRAFFPFALVPIQALLGAGAAAFFFTAPSFQGVSVFDVQGSYSTGILVMYGSLIGILSLRALFRMSAVELAGCEVGAVGVRLLPGLFYLDADTRDIVMAGRRRSASMHFAGLTAVVLATLFGGGLWVSSGGVLADVAVVVYFTGILLLFLFTSPLYRSDLFNALDALFNVPQLDRHAQNYLRKKFIGRIFSRSAVQQDEKFLVVLSTFGLMWLYVGLLIFSSFVLDQFYFMLRDLGEVSRLDQIAILFLAVNFLAPIVTIVGFFLFTIATNVVHAAQKAAEKGKVARKRRGSEALSAEEILGILEQNPLFVELSDEERQELAGVVKVHRFAPREPIVVQGEPGDAFYIVIEGEVEVVKEEVSGWERRLDVLSAGDSFGEIALLESVPRTATVRALKPTRVLRLEKETFEKFVAGSEEKRRRLTDWIRFYAKLHRSPFFQEMSPGQMMGIMQRLSKEPVEKGQVVIKEGEIGDRFYIVLQGDFEVVKAKQGKEEVKAKLGASDYFGDIALLKGVPRTATVRAATEGTVLSLSSTEFLDVVRRNLKFGLLLENVAESRLSAMAGGGARNQ